MRSSSSRGLRVTAHEGRTIRIGGLTTTLKVTEQLTSRAVALVEHTLEPGLLGAVPHRHQHEDEISHVLEGTLTVRLGDEIVTAGPGEYVIQPSGQFHTFWNAGSEAVRFLEVISPAGFERYFAELAALVLAEGAPDTQAVAELAARYGLEFDASGLTELMQEHGIRLG